MNTAVILFEFIADLVYPFGEYLLRRLSLQSECVAVD